MIKKYRVIVKVDKTNFKKWAVNDLVLFVKFLDTNYSGWKYFNVYAYVGSSGGGIGEQLGSFTNKNKPVRKWI